jgi:glycosyltransferase involved in cell wall biosynthesis
MMEFSINTTLLSALLSSITVQSLTLMMGLPLTAVAALLLVPIMLLVSECVAAFCRVSTSQLSPTYTEPGNRVAILIPAHNEALEIGITLRSLLTQINPQDHLIVIADNCTDETAEIARRAGVTVLERYDTEHCGKGFALDVGFRYLQTNPPDVVVILDADSQFSSGSYQVLVKEAMRWRTPIQATYLMEQPVRPSVKDGISAFAFLVKNLVRPLGLKRLGQACELMGTGMAFPWQVAMTVSFANDHIVEDLKLGLDLSIAGFPPRYCPQALVTSRLPKGEDAAKGQRKRWEHGYLSTMIEYVPRLVNQGLTQRRIDLLVSATDLSILPLSLLVMLWGCLILVAGLVAFLSGYFIPLALLIAAGAGLGVSILLAWYRYGQAVLSLQQLAQVPLYVLWKIPLYLEFLINPEKRWVRTKRDST